MVAISFLGPGGYPKEGYGSFSGKPSRVFTQQFSVLGPQGVPRPPYGNFAAKSGGGGGSGSTVGSGPGSVSLPDIGVTIFVGGCSFISTTLDVATIGVTILAGVSLPTAASTPANGYVTEDGSIFYVDEDGATFYVQEG